ncbi:uncharacterized protein LOC134230825, partial [Saccostrea cucullata]|uniref:uncharacterized protein LOC134230825 n=1 Tax=Saccostrea cuccullata TaxID=36930 RepID=UPI002ED2EB3C
MTSLSLRKQLYVLIFLSETMPTMEVYCPASEPTMREVQTCPTTLEALKTAMRIKNCESMSTMQNCTSAENFRYHCVLQMNLNKLVDVCAPSIYSQGKCVKYDTVGKGIQQIEEKSCQHYKNPCPIGFSSWNSTAYADCYMLLEDLKENDDSTTENILPIIAIVVFVVLFLVLLVIGLVIKRRKGHKEAENN